MTGVINQVPVRPGDTHADATTPNDLNAQKPHQSQEGNQEDPGPHHERNQGEVAPPIEGNPIEPTDSKPPEGEEEDEDDGSSAEELLQRSAERPKEPKVVLSEEELALPNAERALIIQRKLREQRLAQEREEAFQAEKKRILSQKALLETKQKMEELEARRAREQFEREKKEKKEAEERQRELLRQDYRERFGKELDEEALAEQALSKKSSREQIKHWVGLLAILPSRADRSVNKETLARCIKALIVYCDNAIANPLVPKFLTINKTNKAFQERVAPIREAIKLLQAVGFQEIDDHLTIQGYPNTHALSQASELLKHIMKTLS